MKNRLGVCSWSLRPTCPEELVTHLRGLGLDGVQLALDPLRDGSWSTERTRLLLREAGVSIRSGMMMMQGEDYSTLDSIRRTGGVRLDEHWDANRRAASANAKVAAQLGLDLITFHAGFLPEDADDPERGVLLERLREVVDRFAEHGLRTAFETGQESADTLLEFLDELERPDAGVNFDPANMLLYGMGEPVAALERLSAHVFQIHLKDATPSPTPGEWGSEVPVGSGQVAWGRFFDHVHAAGLDVDLLIEREAGEDRTGDIATARDLVLAQLAARSDA